MHFIGCINAVWEFSSLDDLSSDVRAENAVLMPAGAAWLEGHRGTWPLTSAVLNSGGEQPGSYQQQLRTGLQHCCLPILTQSFSKSGRSEQG